MDEIILECFLETLNSDFNNFLESISNRFGLLGNFDKSILIEKYPFDKLIINKKNPNKKIIHRIAPNNYRCSARVWGGKESVYYCPRQKKWVYGNQCSRSCYQNKKYCKTHYNQSISDHGLTHGDFNKDPPHNHYLKYKRTYAILHGIELN